MSNVESKLKQRMQALLEVEQVGEQAAQAVSLDQSRVGRLSRMDALQSQAISMESNRRRQLEIQNIKAALYRLAHDEYGFCTTCGEAIHEKRLEFDPAVSCCIDCASKAENT